MKPFVPMLLGLGWLFEDSDTDTPIKSMKRFHNQQTLPRKISVQALEMLAEWTIQTKEKAYELELTPIQEEHWHLWVDSQTMDHYNNYENSHFSDDQFAKECLYEGQGDRELEIIKSASDVALELRAARLAGFDVKQMSRIHVSVGEAE